MQPLVATDVTVPGLKATGAFFTSLTTADYEHKTPAQAYPAIDSADNEPSPNFANIIFPANFVKLERTVLFGKERASLVVIAGQFRPEPTTANPNEGNERLIVRADIDVAYSNATGSSEPPLISEVGAVMHADNTSATIFLRATDPSGLPLHKVGALYNDGDHNWRFTLLNSVGGGLYSNDVTDLTRPPEIMGEAQGKNGGVGYSANKGFNYTASPADTTAPTITIESAAQDASYGLGVKVPASYGCSDKGGVKSCVGTVANGAPIDTSTLGQHTFSVTATDVSGNTIDKTVTYNVGWAWRGFLLPARNAPVLNERVAGWILLLRFSLGGNRGMNILQDGYPKSVQVSCATAPAVAGTEDPTTYAPGLVFIPIIEQYIYVWKSDPAWAGTCRKFILRLNDGSEHVAYYTFR
jgi:hypothetical protein